jgi:ATP-binding cassette subfamily C protein CydD
MAWIGQRPHIFPGTIIDNIRLGRADVGSNEIADALAFAHLDRALRECDSGSIGENGVGLSGGEALRLALARIAVTPSADLILADEPTAHLDIDTAQEITTGLLRLAVGRTLVLATHDPALASRMDRIVRLEPQSLSEAA